VDPKIVKTKIKEHLPLIGVLLGVLLVLASMGIYTNWDAETEFSAAQSVITKGFPYVASGLMIDQAPLAFYLTAPALQLFGASYVNGATFVTMLGFGCVVLIYILGSILYGKKSGLVASALFGLVPWQVFMSRTYLIDVPYLFLSLIFVIFGVLAIKQNSNRYLALCGLFFALALLTKLFSVFFMIPLLLMVGLKGKETHFKLTPKRALIFLIPTIITQTIWYGGLANQNFYGVYYHPDFQNTNQIINPSLLFLPRIYVESAGWFLLITAVFAIMITIGFRQQLKKILVADVICSSTILVVTLLNLGLVMGLHMLVPYVSAFKYDFATVPFLCLLAASLADKSTLLFQSQEKRKIKRTVICIGLVLVFASLVESIAFLNHTEPYTLVDFKSDLDGHYFPFNVFSAVSSKFVAWHYISLSLITVSLAYPLLLSIYRRRRTGFCKYKNYRGNQ
jgi:4-amino-4-deoxy-L-arabinose transferase-like glycosyltransferase